MKKLLVCLVLFLSIASAQVNHSSQTASNKKNVKYILRDYQYDDYYAGSGVWVRNKSRALPLEYSEAKALREKLRYDPDDEYADPAPIVLIKVIKK